MKTYNPAQEGIDAAYDENQFRAAGMREMRFDTHVEYAFWGNVHVSSNEEALKLRNHWAKRMRAEGFKVRCFCRRDQERKYSGLGQSDGTGGHVYICDVQLGREA